MALNFSSSRRNTHFPSRSRTAPKYPTLRWVGWWSNTGSLISGGIHMRQQEPCCWKRTSSMAQRSMALSLARRRVFFKLLFLSRIGTCNQRTRLAQAEAKLSKQSLALSHAQIDLPLPGDKSRQSFAVPKVRRKAEVFRRLSQCRGNLCQLSLGESLRSSRAVAIDQSGQAFLFIALHPICHSTMSVSKKSGHLTAAHALCHKEDTVQPMIISRFLRPTNLLLQGRNCQCRIGNGQRFHA
jgi:hypothetical protein